MLLELSIPSALLQSPGNNQGKVSEFFQSLEKFHLLAKTCQQRLSLSFYFQLFVSGIFSTFNDLAPVVQTLDSAIQQIKFIQWIVLSKV